MCRLFITNNDSSLIDLSWVFNSPQIDKEKKSILFKGIKKA